jgi:hypothetical protein
MYALDARVVVLVAAVMAAGLTVGAQSHPTIRPVPGDVNSTLFEVGNSMGMLRTLDYEDLIVTLELWATGSITINGQMSELTNYRQSVNYRIPGLREDLSFVGASGPTRQIQVVAGSFAWDETERGMGATRAPQAVKERLVQLWTTPMGIYKAAKLAGDQATVEISGTDTVLTYPLPAPVSDVTVRATLSTDSAHMVEPHELAFPGIVGTYILRAETLGGVVSDTTYAEYGEWNWDDYRSDVMLPRRMVQRRADGTVLDLTIRETNTYNPYVVMPVPDAVRAGGNP